MEEERRKGKEVRVRENVKPRACKVASLSARVLYRRHSVHSGPDMILIHHDTELYVS